jgi:dihydroflavonol-4-reductase
MKETMYLLTGAAGYLGSNMSRQLLEQGKKVRALVLNGDKARSHIPNGVEIVDGDLLDTASLEQFFTVDADEYDTVVYHMASWVALNPEWNEKVKAVNVDGTANILDMCIKHRVKKLVYVSSIGAIPDLPKGQTISEINHFDPDKVEGCYSKTKAMATQLVLDSGSGTGNYSEAALKKRGLEPFELKVSIVHPSGICGPGDFSFGFMTDFIAKAASGKMRIGVTGTFNAVDVRDLASATIAAADKGRPGECYILSNVEASCKDILKIVAECKGRKYRGLIIPAGIASFAAGIFEALIKITGIKPKGIFAFFTRFTIQNLVRNNNFSCAKAKNELGFKTRPFKESIEDNITWLESVANSEGASNGVF